MKVLIVGSDDIFAIENIYARQLRENGLEVRQFPATTIFRTYYYKGILNKILSKTGLSGIFRLINEELKSIVEEWQPQVIWVFKGMEIFPSTIELLKKKGIIMANYNPDNPFIFTGSGSGNKNVTDSINLFDIHFTYNMDIKQKLEETGNRTVYYLPFGYELDQELFLQCADQLEVLKTCFVGNPDIKRAAFIKALAEKGISMDIYGNHWNKFVDHDNITIFSEVKKSEFWKTLRRYRIQLNLTRIHSEDSHNMRTFEVPGIGGIMLAKDTSEHRMFFEHGKEVFLYSDLGDCIHQISMLLNMPPGEASKIRANAIERSINSGYSYADRAKMVSRVFAEYSN